MGMDLWCWFTRSISQLGGAARWAGFVGTSHAPGGADHSHKPDRVDVSRCVATDVDHGADSRERGRRHLAACWCSGIRIGRGGGGGGSGGGRRPPRSFSASVLPSVWAVTKGCDAWCLRRSGAIRSCEEEPARRRRRLERSGACGPPACPAVPRRLFIRFCVVVSPCIGA